MIAATLAPAVPAVELRDLDTVPQTPTLEWRQRMAERAVLRAQELDGHGRHLLLAGDPVAPGEVVAAPSAPTIDIAVCLLDIDETAQRERLRRRGDPEEHLRAMSRLRTGCAVTLAIPGTCPTYCAPAAGKPCGGHG